MTSYREIGGAAGIHITLCGDNKSLIKIKKNIWKDRILKLSVKGTFIQIAMLFAKDTSTHNLYKYVGGAENIHDELTSNVLGMLRNG